RAAARGAAGDHRRRHPRRGGGAGRPWSVQMMWQSVSQAVLAASPTPAPTVPGAGIFSSPLLLSLTVWVPVAVAVAIAVMPNPRGRYETLMKQIAFFTNLGMM